MFSVSPCQTLGACTLHCRFCILIMASPLSTTQADSPSPKAASTGIETASLAHSEHKARSGILSCSAFPGYAERKIHTGLCAKD